MQKIDIYTRDGYAPSTVYFSSSMHVRRSVLKKRQRTSVIPVIRRFLGIALNVCIPARAWERLWNS